MNDLNGQKVQFVHTRYSQGRAFLVWERGRYLCVAHRMYSACDRQWCVWVGIRKYAGHWFDRMYYDRRRRSPEGVRKPFGVNISENYPWYLPRWRYSAYRWTNQFEEYSPKRHGSLLAFAMKYAQRAVDWLDAVDEKGWSR